MKHIPYLTCIYWLCALCIALWTCSYVLDVTNIFIRINIFDVLFQPPVETLYKLRDVYYVLRYSDLPPSYYTVLAHMTLCYLFGVFFFVGVYQYEKWRIRNRK